MERAAVERAAEERAAEDLAAVFVAMMAWNRGSEDREIRLACLRRFAEHDCVIRHCGTETSSWRSNNQPLRTFTQVSHEYEFCEAMLAAHPTNEQIENFVQHAGSDDGRLTWRNWLRSYSPDPDLCEALQGACRCGRSGGSSESQRYRGQHAAGPICLPFDSRGHAAGRDRVRAHVEVDEQRIWSARRRDT